MHHASPDPARSRALAPASLALLALCLLAVGAQALMLPLDDAALATGADEVVRGEITTVSSRWNADHTDIVTIADLRVKGRAKGTGPGTLVLTVPGGTVDGITEWVEDEPVLVNGTEAFVFVAHTPKGNRVYGGSQGIVPVGQSRVRGNGKTKGGGVPADAYGQYLGELAAGRAGNPPAAEPVPRATTGTVPVITGVSPATGSGGTESWITITGTGFGSRSSYADVGFVYRYDGSTVTPIWASGHPDPGWNADNIGAWSDTEITVRIPTGITVDGYAGAASSGYLWVLTGENVASANHPFTVTFAYGGLKWTAPASFRVNPAGWGAGAVSVFEDAAAPWNAAIPNASFHFDYAGTTTGASTGEDGQNLVYLGDPANFVGKTVLATTYLWTDWNGHVVDADIVFNPAYPWTTDPAGPGRYIGTTSLHEFGHWLSLRDLYGWVPGYPSDAAKAMFGYVGRGSMALTPDDTAGIRWVYPDAGPAPTPGAAQPSPYPGPHPVGTRIEAENYDTGGEGVAYHDYEPANLGGAYRPAEGVDVEAEGGTTNVGWVRTGEWLSYTVNATAPRSVAVRLRASNPDAAAKRVWVSTGNGYPVALVVPSTGSFGTYALALSEPFWLPAGATAIRLDFAETERANLDWLEVLPAVLPAGTTITKVPTSVVTTPPTPNLTPALTITAPGRYTLDGDLSADVYGVVISSSDVILDGMGHTVACSAPASTWGSGVSAQGQASDATISNVTVRNLTARGWSPGIDVLWATDVLVEEVLSEQNGGWGIRLTGCTRTRVRDSSFRDNNDIGIVVYPPSSGVAITGCSVSGSVSLAGIWVLGNESGGEPAVIEASNVSYNGNQGIVIEGGAGATIRNSTILGNRLGAGIRLMRCTAQVEENRIRGNAGAGVDASGRGSGTITGNRIEGNAAGARPDVSGEAAPLEVWNNVMNNTGDGDFSLAGVAPRLNVTRTAGPNIVGGPSIGGNFWAAPDGTGFSEMHPDADGDGFCDEPFVTGTGPTDFLPLALPGVAAVPGGGGIPTDTNGDGVYDDVNGNGRPDFADVVLYFNQMTWIAANEPVALFDCNGNGRIDFADVVWLFNHR